MSWASASVAITAKAAEHLLGGAGLGPPVTGVTAIAGTEGFAHRFAGGTVYWSLLYGACVVGDEIDARYRELGGPASRPEGWLGFPIADEVPAGSGGYVRFEFQGSGLAYHPAHGTHVVYGLIGEHYWHVLGGPAGGWGFPLTDEYPDGNGRASDFEGGTLFWSPDGDGILEIYASDPDTAGQPAAPAGAALTAADGQAVKQRWDTAGGLQTHETDQDRRTRAYQVWRERADQAASQQPPDRRAQWQDWLTADEARQRWELRRNGTEPAQPGPQPDGMGGAPPRPALRKVTTVADLDQLFREAGITDPRMIVMMKAVSRHEGGFEAVNTYDTGFVSVGYIQFTTGAEGKGSLHGLLRRLKAADPAAFQASFTDLGVDAGASSVMVVDLPVRTLADLAAQERRIVDRLKNRHDVFGDAELSQPADPPD